MRADREGMAGFGDHGEVGEGGPEPDTVVIPGAGPALPVEVAGKVGVTAGTVEFGSLTGGPGRDAPLVEAIQDDKFQRSEADAEPVVLIEVAFFPGNRCGHAGTMRGGSIKSRRRGLIFRAHGLRHLR